MTSRDKILLSIENNIATLTINRPEKRNALSTDMWQGIESTLEAVENNADVHVLIIAGSGGKAFCAGADIAEIASNIDNEAEQRLNNALIERTNIKLETLNRPTIAMIEGSCYGGGCGLSLACDFRIATDNSSFAITPAKLGVLYSLRDTQRLYNLVGPAITKEMLYTGGQLDAKKALSVGLISKLVSSAELLDTTMAFAAELASRSLYSQRGIKATLALLEGTAELNEQAVKKLFDEGFSGEDCREGTSAFLAKRSPNFKYK